MFHLRRIGLLKLTSERFDLRLGQWACFATAPVLLFFAVRAVIRFASTPGELVIGLLSACMLMLLSITIGLVLTLACDRRQQSTDIG